MNMPHMQINLSILTEVLCDNDDGDNVYLRLLNNIYNFCETVEQTIIHNLKQPASDKNNINVN